MYAPYRRRQRRRQNNLIALPHTFLSHCAVVLLLAAALQASPPPTAELARQAAGLLQNGKAQEAAGLLVRAVAADPAFYPAHSLLGVAYTQLGKPETARPHFERAVQLAPGSVPARNNLGANYLALKRPAEAAAQFEKVLAADPANVSAWVNVANAYTQLKKTAQALQALERAKQLAPGDPQVSLTLAEARLQSGKSVHPDPALAPLLLDRAAKHMDDGAYGNALRLLAALESTESNSARWNEMTGYCEFQLGRAEPALKHLQAAIRINPANEDAYLTLAEFLGTNNAVDPIVTFFESAVRALPRSTKIRSGLGVAYWMRGDFDRAESVLRALVHDHPNDPVAYKLLADCHNRAQAWPKLKQTAEDLRKVNPKLAAGWYYGALAEFRLMTPGARDASLTRIREFTRTATRLDPADWRSHVLLGKLAVEEKRPLDAVAAFRKAVSVHPDEPSSHYLLATALRQAGKAEESRLEFDAFRRAQEKEKAREFRTLRVEIR